MSKGPQREGQVRTQKEIDQLRSPLKHRGRDKSGHRKTVIEGGVLTKAFDWT